MANFREVNKAVKVCFPVLDIEVVRGKGYVYFCGVDAIGLDLESIMTHPVSTSTEDLIRMAIVDITESVLAVHRDFDAVQNRIKAASSEVDND